MHNLYVLVLWPEGVGDAKNRIGDCGLGKYIDLLYGVCRLVLYLKKTFYFYFFLFPGVGVRICTDNRSISPSF